MKKTGHARLRQTLAAATSTAHGKNLRPTGRKKNDANTPALKKAANTSPPKVTASTMLASGVGKKSREAFGVAPLEIL